MTADRPVFADIMRPASNNFALLRLVAAAAVVVSHAFQIGTGDVGAQPLAGATSYNLGQHAVNVFFVMSGVMVAGSLERSSSLIDFAMARALRILPGLLVCALVLTFLVGPVVSSRGFLAYAVDPQVWLYPLKVLSLVGADATLPGVFDRLAIPDLVAEPLWTLKYEVFCYALLFGMATIGAWSSPRVFLAIAAVSIVGCAALMIAKPFPSEASPIDHLARLWLCFLLGMMAYRYRTRIVLSWPIFAALALTYFLARHGRLALVASVCLTGYGALLLAAVPAGGMRALANRTDLSFGIYIYGWPATQLLVQAVPGIGVPVLALSALALSAAVAWLSWRLVEKPSLRMRSAIVPMLERRAASLGLGFFGPAVAASSPRG